MITRHAGAGKLLKLAWDLDHVEDQNQWEMLREPVTPDEEEMFDDLCGEKGTLWEPAMRSEGCPASATIRQVEVFR